MLGILKDLIRGKPSGLVASRSSQGRVDLERRFAIIAPTSQGSMSHVYKAIDNTTGKTVCLKVQIQDKHEAALARAHVDNRPDEGEIGLKIVHPNVVRTYECGVSKEGAHYIVMEYVDGVHLQYVRQATKLGTRGKVKLLWQAAEGFAAIHQAGFIHRDINPHNVIVTTRNEVKIIDFGLSVPNTPEYRKPGNRTGTLEYMAPELIRREPTDERLDIFAFGVVAYELMTGKRPYDAPGSIPAMLQKMNLGAMPANLLNPKLSPELTKVLAKAILVRKDDRWSSMAEFARALREVPVKAEPSV